MPHKIFLFSACLALSQGLTALEIRTYIASRHDRFLDFPSDPKINPNFLNSSTDLTGVGWYLAPSNTTVERRRRYTLVSPKHFVGANHFRPSTNGQLRFLSGDGVVRTYGISSVQSVPNPNGDPSDLMLGTLETAVDPGDGVNFQPFLSVAEPSYIGQELIFMGHFRSGNPTLRAGRAVLQARFQFGEGTAIGGDTGIERSEVFSWTFRENTLINTGNPNDSFTEPGDSGGPSLVAVNGRGALVGTHTAAGSANVLISSQNISYDTFVPFYIDGLNEVMAEEGYHMTRAVPGPNQPNAPLGLTVDLPPAIRAGYPITLPATLTNTAAAENANNLKLVTTLPPNESLTASGTQWVVSLDGSEVQARKGGLPASNESIFSIDFTPTQPGSYSSDFTYSADESPETTETVELIVLESFRSWSAGLSDPSTDGDPDGDRIPNLQEYAFGGEPGTPGFFTESGSRLLPALEDSPTGLVFNIRQRTDATARALAYIVEASPDLSEGSWQVVEETGDPAREADGAGFERVKRSISGPETARFFRVRIELSEDPEG